MYFIRVFFCIRYIWSASACMYDMPSLMNFICAACHVLYIYAKPNMLHTNFNVYCTCIIIREWCTKTLACYTNILVYHVNFDTCCMIIDFWYVKIYMLHHHSFIDFHSCCIAFTHFCYISIFIYAICQLKKFMLYQDLSAVPLFPSSRTAKSYHHLQ